MNDLPDAVSIDLDYHMRENADDVRRDIITAEVWQALANGDLDIGLLDMDCCADTFQIALYECFKDNRPALATFFEPRCSYRDFAASVEALVEDEIERRMNR